jgi:hypothetical protein
MSDTKGLYLGKSHADGGIPAVNTDTGQQLEIEGQEYKVCNSAYSSNKILRYSNKTNKEILDDIHDNFSCRFNKNEVKNGEFILCKVVVLDPTKRSRKGTVRQILDEMQSEKSCNVSQGAAELSLGGKIGAEGKRVEFILDGQNRERFEISDRNAKLDEINLLRLCKKSLEVKEKVNTFVENILPFWQGYDFYPDLKSVKVEVNPFYGDDEYALAYIKSEDLILINSTKIIREYGRGLNKRKGSENDRGEKNNENRQENVDLLDRELRRADPRREEETNGIYMSQNRKSLRGQFFHELQHVIQKREGIEISISNPTYILKQLKEINGKQHFSDKDFIDYIEKKEGREYRFIEYDFYQNLPSEKEALQVEKRSFLTKKQLKEKPFEFEQGGEISEDEKIYKEWTELVNMSASELKAFMKTDEGKDAGLDPKEAKRLGIKSGQESARWIIKMKSTNKDKWTLTMWDWAKRQINFIKRMRGNKGKLFDENGIKTRKHTSLLIWGYDPKLDLSKQTFIAKNSNQKFENGGEVSTELHLVIRNVNQENKYKGSYKKIFDILDEGVVLYNPFGTTYEKIVGNDFYITITPMPDYDKVEKIKGVKNVDVIEAADLGKTVEKHHLGGDMTKHLAPNGKPSNLNHEQWHLVRSESFKNWFGNWLTDPENASKVVDENGEPLVVWHGSKKEFNIFGKDKNNDIIDEYKEQYAFKEKVHHFHKDKTYAETFGSKYNGYEKSFFLDIKKIGLVEEDTIEDIGYWKDIYDYYVTIEGLDGIFSKSGQYATLLNPNQIKLADGTNNTFDMNSNDIRYEQGGETNNAIMKELRSTDVKTGEPISFYYSHAKNKQKTPNFGAKYGQNIEPHGKYIISVSESYGKLEDNDRTSYEYGIITFKNPLVLEHKSTDDKGWKKDLMDMFGGKKGSALSKEIIKKGYDGIITTDGNYVSEIVALNEFKMENGGEIDEAMQGFDWTSLFDKSPEKEQQINEQIERSKEQEREEWYQGTSFSKKWAATYQEAVNKTVKEYFDAKATYNDWSSRQYKENKSIVFLGDDDILGQAKSIGSINEGKRRNVLNGAKMQMDEAIETLKELQLSDNEIADLLKNKLEQGGEIPTLNKKELEKMEDTKIAYLTTIEYEDNGKTVTWGTKNNRGRETVIGKSNEDLKEEIKYLKEMIIIGEIELKKAKEVYESVKHLGSPKMYKQVADALSFLKMTERTLYINKEILLPFFERNLSVINNKMENSKIKVGDKVQLNETYFGTAIDTEGEVLKIRTIDGEPHAEIYLGDNKGGQKLKATIPFSYLSVINNKMKEDTVVLNEGNGVIVNEIYKEWSNITSPNDWNDWAFKVRSLKFGTYKTIGFLEVLEEFNFKDAKINDVLKNDFLKEVKQALNYGKMIEIEEEKTPKMEEKEQLIWFTDEALEFVPEHQLPVIKGAKREYQDAIYRINKAVKDMPTTYSTEGIEDKKVYLHYFSPSADWHIVEKDMSASVDGHLQDFGYANLGYGAELGYISIDELKSIKEVNLDLYFEPVRWSSLSGESINTDINAYKNPYELNRAIEKLIDSRGDERNAYDSKDIEFISYYSGYGGLEKFGSFADDELKRLKYEFFTPDEVCKKMWALAYKYGYGTVGDSSVFEPSVGTGNFLKYAPKNVIIGANEINKYSAIICQILHPNVDLNLISFERNFIKNNLSIKAKTDSLKKYSLVIGNPPYGSLGGLYITRGEDSYSDASNWTEYFIFRGLDLLHKDGLLIFVVGAEQYNGGTMFLDSKKSKIKSKIAEKADLVDAYRLPINIFERTGVSSEIVIFKKK